MAASPLDREKPSFMIGVLFRRRTEICKADSIPLVFAVDSQGLSASDAFLAPENKSHWLTCP
jgi:hypothetical protein